MRFQPFRPRTQVPHEGFDETDHFCPAPAGILYRKLHQPTIRRVVGIVAVIAGLSVHASDLDTLGVPLLRQFSPSLLGTGVRVAQPEAAGSVFEVNPAVVGQPVSLFTYINSSGATATSFPNGIGSESGHADTVGGNFYGIANGVAPQVSHVDNYEVNWFITLVANKVTVPARVVNQSFVDNVFDPSLDQVYDDYADSNKTVFVSAAANPAVVGPLCSPGTCYNGVGVGRYDLIVPGPTPDGRCKPDFVVPDLAQAPNGAVSYSTAYASGCAAVLVQAANRGDGGVANTNAAADLRTIKALLINGAIKPGDWTNSPTSPLDARYGSGLLNVFNSWTQLKGGKHSFIEFSTVPSGNSHPPGSNLANEPVLIGWDTNTLSTSASVDQINHYYFNLPGTNAYTFTATLVWNRHKGTNTLNDLDLFLLNTANSNLVTSSVSAVDNVEHLFALNLPPGRYDLQVLKNGPAQVSTLERYALAFEFFSMPLSFTVTNGNATFTWPASPTGFALQSTATLNPPSWSTLNAAVSVDTNLNQNSVTLPVADGNQFFRLIRPPPNFGL